MVLALKDKWIWDFWLVKNEADWHIYFLQADNTLPDPEMRHRNVTQGHAMSQDLVNWTSLGTCFAPSKTESWDDWTTWTGSVVKADNGVWHLFYTGTQHEGAGLIQRIGHATSQDMHSWVRVGNGLCLDLTGPNAHFYEEYTPGHWPDRAMRDPWVIKNPEGDGWLMYFTARVPGRAEPNAGGAIGFATSPDLNNWTLQPPVYTDGNFGQLEVPQVFKFGDYWYCTFCTAAEHWAESYKAGNAQTPVTGNSYLISTSHLGPWKAAKPFLDGANPCKRYAGKIVEQNGKLNLLGFLYYDEAGTFIGKVGNPVNLAVAANGALEVVQ
jgi:beta-fructofuranosidase